MDIYKTITKQNPSWGIAGFWWFFVFLLCFSRIIKQSYNPQEKINSWIIVHNIKRFEFVPEFLDGNLWSAGSVGDSESCGIQWMKSVRVYNVFSFVQHMVKHIRKNAVVGHVIFGDGILCTHRFHHLRSCYVIRVILSSDPFSG